MKAFTNFFFMAVLSCLTLVATAQNRCLNYDGNNDRVAFTSPMTSAGLMNNFSVACRFKAANTDNQGYIYRLFGWGTDRFEFGDQNGTLVFYTNETGIVPTAATGIRDGQCHNVVVTKSSSPNVVRVFYDGTLVLTQPLIFPLTLSSLARVGDWAGGATAPSRWKGLIDDFEVYEGALTAAQVATLNSYGTILQPLLLQFPFNQGVPAGINTGLTNVINTVGAAGVAQNFALTGPTSNWVIWPCGPQQQEPLNINCNLSADQQFLQVCNDPGLCGATVFYPTPIITGGWPPYSINTTFPSGGFMPIGYTQVCNTVIDATGATATCCFWVLVQDCEAPTIFCASNIVCNDPGLCSGTLPDVTGSVGANDNCGPVTISQSPFAGSTLPIGLSLVTMTATDASGNTATCYNYVQVNDCEAPTVICPNDQTVCNDPNVCSAWFFAPNPFYYDNCNDGTVAGSISISSNQPTGWVNLPAMQSHLFSFVVTDAAGNTATCQYGITVLDCEAPVVTCPPNQTVCNDPGLCSATINATDASYSDNCGIATVNVNQPIGLLSLPVGVHTWTFIGTDFSGNNGTCSYSISILDCEPPTLLCPPQGTSVVVCNTPNFCGAILSTIAPTATDNCGGPVTVTSSLSTPFIPIGNSWVCFIATDAAGNVSDCCFQVQVNDCEPPVITCPANQTVCVCGTYTPATPIVSDNCGIVTVGTPMISGTYLAGTTTTITYLATDASGNTATCSYTVTVPACTTPVITLVNSITSTSFKIFYTKPLCATQMQYQIRYQIGAGWSAWTTVTYAATGASKLITGLVCGRTYQVRIRAKCCNVYSSWSAVKTVTTKACGTNMTAQNDADPTTTVATKLEAARLYPNPATNVVNIEIAQLDAQTTLSLTDLNGRTLATTTPDESGLTQLEVGNLPSGVYVVVIRNSQTVQTLRFVKE